MTSSPLPVASSVGARTAFAFWLDALLLALFLLEESPRITGVAGHRGAYK